LRKWFRIHINSPDRVVVIDAGATFEAHLTPGALGALELKAAMQILLVIKTYSCNLVEPSPGQPLLE